MLGFGKRGGGGSGTPRPDVPALAADDPLRRARQLSDEVFDAVVKPLKLQGRLESAYIASILGVLAGYSCQRAALAGLAAGDPAYCDLPTPILDMGLKDGTHLLYGDAINRPLLESQYSVWALVGGILQHIGKPVFDVRALVARKTGEAGTPAFERCAGLPLDGPPIPFALGWRNVALDLESRLPRDFVPMVFAFAFQRLAQTDAAADPSVDVELCARTMMESAIVASKLPEVVDPVPTS